ncbi:MAG: aquaporin family protein [Thermoplasmata archaeon]|nr:aquaporin family protein [Thermoplasmata archaeon]
MSPSLLSRLGAELAGTALLVGIGTGAIVGAVGTGGIPQWQMAIAWFLAVLLPVILFIRISGAHLNPAVTLALALSRRMPRSEAPAYVAAQIAGAFLGSTAVLLSLGDHAHLGATTPSIENLPAVFGAELLFTGALVGSVFVLADARPERGRWCVLLPPAVVGISTFFIGPITGSSLNPARSIAPAVLSGTFTDLWVYLVAVPLAAILVAMLWGRGNDGAPPAAPRTNSGDEGSGGPMGGPKPDGLSARRLP